MGVVYAESFEFGALNPGAGSGYTFVTDPVHSGDYACRVASLGYVQLPLLSDLSPPCTIMIACRFSNRDTWKNLGLLSTAGDDVDIWFKNNSGWQEVDLEVAGSVKATGLMKWPIDQWGMIAIEITTSLIRVLFNGNVVVSYNPGSSDTFQTASFGSGRLLGQAQFWDDLIVLDESFPGHLRIYPFKPDADDTQGLTRSAGSDNYALVDEAANDGDTTYVYSSAGRVYDLYNFTVVEGPSGIRWTNVKAVLLSSFSKELAAESGYSRGVIEQGLYAYDTLPLDLETYYEHQQHFWQVNPDTGVAWAVDDLTGGLNAGIMHDHI